MLKKRNKHNLNESFMTIAEIIIAQAKRGVLLNNLKQKDK